MNDEACQVHLARNLRNSSRSGWGRAVRIEPQLSFMHVLAHESTNENGLTQTDAQCSGMAQEKTAEPLGALAHAGPRQKDAYAAACFVSMIPKLFGHGHHEQLFLS